MNWISYEHDKFANQKLPKPKRYLLLQIAGIANLGVPPAVVVGYMKYAAGDKNSPSFIVPGVGGNVVAWCDCLGDDFNAPLWSGTHKNP